MSSSVMELIELARRHEITDEEHDAQIRSFTYGNTHFENESITRADVDRVVDTLSHSHSEVHV